MVKAMIDLKEQFYLAIHDDRVKIAELKQKKAEMKPMLWKEATGTVDQKKDFIKSRTADIDADISVLDADIELRYNQAKILDDKIDLELMKDD